MAFAALKNANEDAVIDRTSRDKAADLIRAYRDGAVTNDELADNFPWKGKGDSALKGIYWALWSTYDDLKEERINPARADPRGLQLLDRCHVFLRSNREFMWPQSRLICGLYGLLSRASGNFRQKFDWNAFPFRSEAELAETDGARLP